jgi:hypothetical protein
MIGPPRALPVRLRHAPVSDTVWKSRRSRDEVVTLSYQVPAGRGEESQGGGRNAAGTSPS